MTETLTTTGTTTQKIVGTALTFDDVLLVPARSNVLPKDVDLRTRFTPGVSLGTPLVSAAMDTVTEVEMAIAMARNGGIGVVHKKMPVADQAEMVRKVKRSESGMIVDPITLGADAKVGDAQRLMREYRISGVPIVSNQVSFSLLDRRALNGMTELCQRSGVNLLAYGTVAGGLLTERWLGRSEPDWDDEGISWSLNKYRRFVEQAGGWETYQDLLETLSSVAGKHGISIANVASRGILDTPGVGAVIIGARLGESEHVDDTLRLFEVRLDAADHADIDAALSRLRPLPGDCGDEYRKAPYLTASGDLSHHLDELPAPFATVFEDSHRKVVGSGTTWESVAGYGRAQRIGDRVLVSGTTAMHGERLIGGSDAAAQTHFVIDKIEGALRSLGAGLKDVVRTRI